MSTSVHQRSRQLRSVIESTLAAYSDAAYQANPNLVARLVGAFLESGLALPEAVDAYGDMYRQKHESNCGRGRSPLGLRPLYVVVPERIAEIIAAMGRYSEQFMPIPCEWLDELRSLSEWMAAGGGQVTLPRE